MSERPCTRKPGGGCILGARHIGGCQYERMPNTAADRLGAEVASLRSRLAQAEAERDALRRRIDAIPEQADRPSCRGESHDAALAPHVCHETGRE